MAEINYDQYAKERQSPRDKLAAQVAAYRAKQAQDEANAQGQYEQYVADQEARQNQNLGSPMAQGAMIGASTGGGYGAAIGAGAGLGLGMLRTGIGSIRNKTNPFADMGNAVMNIPSDILGGAGPNNVANTGAILAQQKAMDDYRKSQIMALANRTQQVVPGYRSEFQSNDAAGSDFKFSDDPLKRRNTYREGPM